jgi:Ni,Fe-hydrogenase III large subunit/Ni,Fe-hydrogenase III component G
MKDLSAVQTMLGVRLQESAAHSFVVRGSTIHLEVPRENLGSAAQVLLGDFALQLSLMVCNDLRLQGKGFQIHYLFANHTENWFAEMRIGVPEKDPQFDSLATLCYPASRCEREIRDLFGLQPQGHPDLRPLVRHAFWPEDYFPLRKGVPPPADFVDQGQAFPFAEVEGEGVYEIPVGPVHAGIIEPGHFRFSVEGETIIDMKSRLYFTHKGTEKLFEGRRPQEGIELSERISGDTSVGHCLAYCQALESLAQVEVPARAQYWRVILLELERMYNHVGDFGMIANDTGFAWGHAHAFRIRERLFRLNKKLTGHRLLRGVLQPGGASRDYPKDVDLLGEIEAVRADFEEVFEICWNISMLRDRLRGTGHLFETTGRAHGVLGYVARASGIDHDVRRDHPFAAYGRLAFRVPVLKSGDVEARTMIRVEEFRESVRLVRQAVEQMPEGKIAEPLGPLPAWQSAFGMVEGWRGGIIHWVMADGEGRLYRVKVQDPSFVNWRPLSFALIKNIVPDFPLCNKSFNLSYSGNDL